MWCALSHLLMPMGCGMDYGSETEESHTRTESALEILKKRYARGEIGKEEFEDKKKGIA